MILRTLLTSYVVLLIAILAFGTPQFESVAAPAVPLPPDAGNAMHPAEADASIPAPQSDTPENPLRLLIPSLKLDDRIVEVGLGAEGEMDVPPGTTKDVGWYKYGTTPGNIGSAVFGAHVYAAFSKLNRLAPGDTIYIATSGGKTLRFVVSKTRTYPLDGIDAEKIFLSTDGKKHLNLITCAGKFSKSHNTYDHRLVVFATMVE